MAANDDGTDVAIHLHLVPESGTGPAASRVPGDPADETSPLADAASFMADDDSSRYRDPTVLLAGAAGATFTGVAVSGPEVDHHGPYDGGVDTGGMDGGE